MYNYHSCIHCKSLTVTTLFGIDPTFVALHFSSFSLWTSFTVFFFFIILLCNYVCMTVGTKYTYLKCCGKLGRTKLASIFCRIQTTWDIPTCFKTSSCKRKVAKVYKKWFFKLDTISIIFEAMRASTTMLCDYFLTL